MICCPRDSSPLRTTTLWPASPCWATLSPSRPSRRTSTKTTSSNSTLNPTSTTSDRRASTPLKGTVNSDRSSKCIYVCLIHRIFGAGAEKNIQLNIDLLDDGHIWNQICANCCLFTCFPASRWMEVIRSATCSASRPLPSTRKDLYWWMCLRRRSACRAKIWTRGCTNTRQRLLLLYCRITPQALDWFHTN